MTSFTLDQLSTFLSIVRAGSFSRAADELFVTQSAVSQRIKHLEATVGQELFVRSANRWALSLTHAGERVRQVATELFELLDGLEKELSAEALVQSSEHLSIVCGPTIAKHILPPLIARFRDSHPDVHVGVQQETGEQIDTLVREGRADVGIRANVRSSSLRALPLFRDAIVIVGEPGYVSRLQPGWWRVAGNRPPFVLTSQGSSLRVIFDAWAESVGLRLKEVMEVDSMESLMEAALVGLGLAMVSQIVVRDEVSAGKLAIVAAPGLPREWEYFLVADPTRPMSSACRALLETALSDDWRNSITAPLSRVTSLGSRLRPVPITDVSHKSG